MQVNDKADLHQTLSFAVLKQLALLSIPRHRPSIVYRVGRWMDVVVVEWARKPILFENSETEL